MNSDGIKSDVVDGMQFFIKQAIAVPAFDSVHSGWQTGSAPIEVKLNLLRSTCFAYNFDIVFVDTTQASTPSYKSKITSTATIQDLTTNVGLTPAAKVLTGWSFPFYVINRDFQDTLDLVVQNVNYKNTTIPSTYEPDSDYVLVAYTYLNNNAPPKIQCYQTIFGIRFIDKNNMPHPGDVYRVRFNRALEDSIMFTVNTDNNTDASKIDDDMKKIKVVPNPYIVTNTMEPYIANQNFNQQRILLFTHVPAQSTIKIFTSSGVFIRQIDVNNAPDNGNIKWNMLTKEGLEIAAGIYVYHIKSKVTGKEKLGKFAVIK
jgi:hypothetical protein